MGKRATAGADLQALVKMALPLLQEAERQCPRTGPGAKPQMPDWWIGLLIMVAIVKRKKSKSAQFRFLRDKTIQRQIVEVAGYNWFPSRSTFFTRYRRAHKLFRKAIELQGQKAIAEGIVDAKAVAVDKSLVAAMGPLWHKRDRQAGRIPKGLYGVDQDSTWGRSQHDGWVQGYSFEVAVTATAGSTVFPLLASVDTASAKETQTSSDKMNALSSVTLYVLVDSGYDSNALAEQVEYDTEGLRTGRRFLCPENKRNSGKKSSLEATAVRDEHHRRRRQRQKYLKSPKGRRLYARRGQTVEPFHDWFKQLFELEHRVWHRGLENNQTQILTAIFIYQLLVRYNYRHGNQNGQIKWIMDTL